MISTASIEDYKASVLQEIRKRLADFYGDIEGLTIEKIREDQASINAYPNLDKLQELKEDQINVLEEGIDTTYAEVAVLNGEFFWEHAAAGEATRLGLGTKYVIDLSTFSIERIRNMILEEIKKELKNQLNAEEKFNNALIAHTLESLHDEIGGNPHNLLPLTLGQRHMLQMVFDVTRLARKHKQDPSSALARQRTLLILNRKTADDILKEFERFSYFGLDRNNVFFMVQQPFNGISISHGDLEFTKGDNERLHNHGQMMMQKAHDHSIFRFIDGKKVFLDVEEFERILSECKDFLSYNIEDIGYLTQAVDLESLALALNLGKRGYDMVMEIVSQNPYKPQKGGAAFFDPKIGKNVMIESNCLKGMRNEDIRHLNKNFNHYPNPVNSFRKMKEHGLNLPFEVKKGNDGVEYIYPCPVQGDMNRIVRTAFVRRKKISPIKNWKSAATTPPTVKAFFRQDSQAGWKEFVSSFISS